MEYDKIRKIYKVLMFIPAFGGLLSFNVAYFLDMEKNYTNRKILFKYFSILVIILLLYVTLTSLIINYVFKQDFVYEIMLVQYFTYGIFINMFFIYFYNSEVVKREPIISDTQSENQNSCNQDSKYIKTKWFFYAIPVFGVFVRYLLAYIFSNGWKTKHYKYTMVFIFISSITTMILSLITTIPIRDILSLSNSMIYISWVIINQIILVLLMETYDKMIRKIT
ncbi:MAG: hypothetical protein WC152_08405 [Candidatus Izemoplasmatales bacterium]